MPFTSAVSLAIVGLLGSKMKARSFRAPSPLMSLPMRGVKGAPDVRRTTDVMSSHGFTSQVVVPTIEWRRSKSLVAHGNTFGSPAVVGEANPPPALLPPPKPPALKNDD